MSEAASFVPGQASLLDRTVDPNPLPPTGSPFAGMKAPSKIVGLSAYSPSVSLAPKPHEVKFHDRVFQVPMLPTSYTHAYLTSVDSLQYEYGGFPGSDALFSYKGNMRLSYRAQSPIAALGPSLKIIEFKAQVTILLRRSAAEHFDQLQVAPLPPDHLRLFPGTVFADLVGMFFFYFTWPNGRADNVDIGLNNGSLLIL